MALPLTAKAFDDVIDPSDVEIFQLELTQGDGTTDLLRVGEGVASFALTVLPEAAAAGLILESGDGRTPAMQGTILTFWVSVDPTQQSALAFDGSGTTFGLVLTIITNAYPSRKKQKTVLIQVAQQ